MRHVLGLFWSKETLFSLPWPTRSSRQGDAVLAGKSSKIGSSPEAEVMLRRQIVRHLTNDYDMERRALLTRRDLPRSELEEILLDRFAEMQAAKPVERQNALLADGQGRGGQGAGGNSGSRRGNRDRRVCGSGRGGTVVQIHLHRTRGNRSTAATKLSFPSSGHR